MEKHSLKIVVFLGGILLFPACSERLPTPPASSPSAHYIINCSTDCSKVEKSIRQSGGNITKRFANFNILAFDLPTGNELQLKALSQYRFYKDIQIAKPSPFEQQNIHLDTTQRIATTHIQSTVKPANYAFKNILNGSAPLHEKSILGENVIVAVIDSGTANNAEVVPALDGNVIGGENFVPDEGEPSATSTLNDEHGTWVGSMIAAHASVVLEKEHELAQAISMYAPESVIPVDDVQVEIPMLGTAPGAKIYALKTFGVESPGAPSSRIIEAMDRVLTLKLNFNSGMPAEPVAGDGSENDPFVYDSLDIKVLNMSLGGPALFPGSEIEDVITDALLEAGVVVVASAGNDGFSAMTGGSPGTAYSALTVGAASEPVHERILRELQLGPESGGLFRPLDNLVIASFSSRGPTADGRISLDLVANGVASFVQGADGHISLVSGTSFSAPTVAGAAALLWNAFPEKTAAEIRNSLIEGADNTLIGKTAKRIDQGHGFLNVENSFKLLEAGEIEPHIPIEPVGNPNSKVSESLAEMGFRILPARRSETTQRLRLKPGEVEHLFIETTARTQSLELEIEHIRPLLPPEEQNALGGDNIIISLVDAPLSTEQSLLREIIDAPVSFDFPHPQPGLLRLAVMGNWTNKGDIFVELEVEKNYGNFLEPVATGTITDEQTIEYQFEINDSVSLFNLALHWTGNWSVYPAHDLDLIIIDPLGNLYFDAATLNSPEMTFFDLPVTGTWIVIVEGFLLHEFVDEYSLFAFDQNNIPLLPVN